MRCVKEIPTKTAGYVPCGRCIVCRLNFSSMWAKRLMDEKKYCEEACFGTLTYDDGHLPEGGEEFKLYGMKYVTGSGSLSKRDVQLFLKKLRKKFSTKLRYYLSGEYGEVNFRPHYHFIMFGISKKNSKEVEAAWDKGFSSVSDVSEDRCNYVAKYVLKKMCGGDASAYIADQLMPEFALMSRGGRGDNNLGGIGSRYVKDYGDEIYERGFIYFKGKKAAIPRYYKSKIYSTEMRKLRRKRELEELQKEKYLKLLDRIKEVGYTEAYRDELLRREGTKILLDGRIKLKRGTL